MRKSKNQKNGNLSSTQLANMVKNKKALNCKLGINYDLTCPIRLGRSLTMTVKLSIFFVTVLFACFMQI